MGNILYLLQTLVPGTAGEALLWLGCGNLWEYSHTCMAPVLAAASFREFTLIHYSENFPHSCGFVVMRWETGRSSVGEVLG